MTQDCTNVRILLVEDSAPISSNLCETIVQELEFEVDVASSFAETKTLLEDNGNEYFLAILDPTLPDASQNEIIDYAMEHRLPAIVYTSNEDQEQRQELLDKNIIDYVYKNSQSTGEIVRLLGRLYRNKSARALVVDDSPLFRRMVRSLLKTYMFQVHVASSGEAALAIMNKHADISLVITDYEMPNMNGAELCKTIRETHSREEVAIIGISAQNDEMLAVRFIKNGANDFIKKPFSREEFYLRVVHNQETIETFRKLRELSELKNRFLGIAAHDLRNPINGIKGFSGLLHDDLGKMGLREQAEMCEFVLNSSTQMLELVNDLLDISVIESGKLDLSYAKTDLEKLIDERLRIMNISAASKDLRLVPRLEKNVIADCDPKRIAQVVDNLLSNAVKFSPMGAVVRVSLSVANDQAEVRVTDQGPGIPEDQWHLLFQTFSKLKTRPSGNETSTGLGLSIVKKIMDTHLGSVGVDSTPGRGASFFFNLPLTRPAGNGNATCA